MPKFQIEFVIVSKTQGNVYLFKWCYILFVFCYVKGTTGQNQLTSSYLTRNRSTYILTWGQRSVRECWACAPPTVGSGTRIPAAEVVVIAIIRMTRTVIFIRSTTATTLRRRQSQVLMWSDGRNSKDVVHIFNYMYIRMVVFDLVYIFNFFFLKIKKLHKLNKGNISSTHVTTNLKRIRLKIRKKTS